MLITCFLLLLPAPALGQPERETAFKAVSLFHFAEFTEWPASAFATPESPIVIGVLGKDPFGGMLEAAVQNERVRGRPLKVERFQSVSQVRGCDILYVSSSEYTRLDEVLASLKNQGILTVGEGDDFARRGGMIQFLTQQGRIRFRVNLAAVRSAGLQLSSKLLRWAEVINPKAEQAVR